MSRDEKKNSVGYLFHGSHSRGRPHVMILERNANARDVYL